MESTEAAPAVVRSHFNLRLAFPLLLCAGLGIGVVGNIIFSRSGDEFAAYTLSYPGVAMVVAGVVCSLVLLHQSWSCLKRHAARFDPKREILDPALAVTMMAIPLVNIVGMFFAIGRLPRELNWLAGKAGVRQRVNGDLGYTLAVMGLLGVIPLIGALLAVIAAVLMIVLLLTCSSLADTIEAALAAEPTSAAPAA